MKNVVIICMEPTTWNFVAIGRYATNITLTKTIMQKVYKFIICILLARYIAIR